MQCVSVLEGEALGLLQALQIQWLADLDMSHVIFETDSKLIFDKCKNKDR